MLVETRTFCVNWYVCSILYSTWCACKRIICPTFAQFNHISAHEYIIHMALAAATITGEKAIFNSILVSFYLRISVYVRVLCTVCNRTLLLIYRCLIGISITSSGISNKHFFM